MRYTLPQPYEDLDHTADVGLRVRGATPEEALARLALAFGTLVTGGAAAAPELEERLTVPSDPGLATGPGPAPAPGPAAVPGDPGLAGTAVSLLRELLFRFATERRLPAEVEVHRVDERGAEATVAFARYDPERHGEGVDVKAVTWHAARLEREGDGWVAQVVLDI